MTTLFEAYDYPVDRLVEFYQRINRIITYPDGMITSLGIIYWGKEEHHQAIGDTIQPLRNVGIPQVLRCICSLKDPRGRQKLR